MNADDQLQTGTTPRHSTYNVAVEAFYVKSMYAIKVINDADCKSFLDLDSARHTIRRIPDGVEGAGGVPAQLKLPNRANTHTFVKLMNVLKFQDPAMVSLSMYRDLFNSLPLHEQLPAIAMFCNDAVMSFIKTLAVYHKTPNYILRFIQTIGDDGDYKWIPQAQVNELFSTFIEYKRSDPKKLESISPHFKSYVFEHSAVVENPAVFKPAVGRKLPRLS